MHADPADFPEPSETPAGAGVSSFRLEGNEDGIAQTAAQLAQGAIAAIPTETVYGLAAIATDADACGRIFQLKGRPLIDPLIVHVGEGENLERIAEVTELARVLIAAFWPGPLTLVLPKTSLIPDIVTAGRPTVALRCPAHPLFQQLYARLRQPLAAPSANPFGYISPTRPEHVLASFPDAGIPVLDGGPCSIGIESTILDLSSSSTPRLLRAGHIQPEAITQHTGLQVELPAANPSDQAASPRSSGLLAPGMMPRHYSPRKPSQLVAHGQMDPARKTALDHARVFFQRPLSDIRPAGDFWLSETGDSAEAAKALYHLLRSIDGSEPWSRILIESAPDIPESRALRDRLSRATRA